MIHPSHSRRDLIEIVEIFEIWIDDFRELNKKDLSKQLWLKLKEEAELPDYTEFFDFEDINDLKIYLKKQTPKNTIPANEKQVIYDKVRNIIFYCKGANYIVFGSNYKDIKDVIKDANDISIYGDEPSVRRALRLLSIDNKIKDIIKPTLSVRAQKRLDDKKRIKLETIPRFRIMKGSFVVKF
jgi:hypothetical protein